MPKGHTTVVKSQMIYDNQTETVNRKRLFELMHCWVNLQMSKTKDFQNWAHWPNR